MKNPSRIAQWILKKFLNQENAAPRLGDFEEVFHSIAESEGNFRAGIWYWKQVIKSIPELLNSSIFWSTAMFKNYFKIAVRNLAKYKYYSAINIGGLAIGIACFLLVLLYL